MEAASIAEILSENKARLSEADEDQGRGEDVFSRYWLVGQDDLDGCVAYLKAMTIVEAPMAGTRWAREGVWYAGRVRYKPGNDNPLVASGANGLVWILSQELSKGTKEITIDEECAAWTKRTVINTYNPSIPSGTASARTIVRVGATPTDLGREQTTKETTTPKDQVSTAYDRSKAADATKVVHTENATPLSQPADVKGTIVRQSAQPTEAGNERTEVDTIVPKDQVATEGEDGGLEKATTVLHTENASTPTAPPASAQGNIKKVVADPTEAGNLRTRETTRESKHVSVNEYLARKGDGELEYRSEEYHDLNPPDVTKYKDSGGVERDLGATESAAILYHELDAFLTHNYKKSRTVKSFPFTGEKTWKVWGDKEVVTSQAYSATLGRYWNDHSYVYHVYAEHTLQYFNNQDDAIAFIHDDNGWDGGTLIDSGGSTWGKTDEFQYLAHKVRNKKTLIATYDYQEPLE